MPKKHPKKPRKGFTRSKKEWEESVSGHIGKFIDRINFKDIPNILMYGGCGYYGYKAFGNNIMGAIIGMVGLKLATAPAAETHFSIGSPLFNVEVPISSQIAGLSILTAIGISNLFTGKRADDLLRRLGDLGEYKPPVEGQLIRPGTYKLPPWL